MNFTNDQLKEILVAKNYVSEEDFSSALKYAEDRNTDTLEYLLNNEILTSALLGQAVAEYYNVNYSNLHIKIPPKETVLKIPQEIAEEFLITIAEEKDDLVTIATVNPRDGLREKYMSCFQINKLL